MRTTPLLTGMLLAALTTATNAAEIKVLCNATNYNTTTIYLRGKIELGDFEKFYVATKNVPFLQGNVVLESNGGSVIAGLAIGSRIQEKRWMTMVDRRCVSVCGLIWLSGSPRVAPEKGGSIGFHAAYNESDGRESGAANALVGAYLKELGFGWETIFYLTKTAPNAIDWLDRAKAKSTASTSIGWVIQFQSVRRKHANLASPNLPVAEAPGAAFRIRRKLR
jgi:hypothetical protein